MFELPLHQQINKQIFINTIMNNSTSLSEFTPTFVQFQFEVQQLKRITEKYSQVSASINTYAFTDAFTIPEYHHLNEYWNVFLIQNKLDNTLNNIYEISDWMSHSLEVLKDHLVANEGLYYDAMAGRSRGEYEAKVGRFIISFKTEEERTQFLQSEKGKSAEIYPKSTII